MSTLAGRTVAITGGGRGLGAAAAREFADRGARVAVLGRTAESVEAVLAGLGGRPGEHLALVADVRDQDSLSGAFDEVGRRFGSLDVLVANAGINRHGSVLTLDGADFADVVDTNLTGVYRTVRAGLDQLLAARGYLLVVSSVAAFASFGNLGAYAAAKAGVDMLAHTLHLELADRGVGVGVLVPTWIDTDLLREAESVMPTFARARAAVSGLAAMLDDAVEGGMPGGTLTAKECAIALVDGVQQRRRRIWVPPVLEELWRLGPTVNGAIGEAVTLRLLGLVQARAEQEAGNEPT